MKVNVDMLQELNDNIEKAREEAQVITGLSSSIQIRDQFKTGYNLGSCLYLI